MKVLTTPCRPGQIYNVPDKRFHPITSPQRKMVREGVSRDRVRVLGNQRKAKEDTCDRSFESQRRSQDKLFHSAPPEIPK
jgi:hypothetical protein